MAKVNTFEDAIKVAIQHYWDNEDDTPALTKVKPRKYTKKYFDKAAEDLLGKKNKPVTPPSKIN